MLPFCCLNSFVFLSCLFGAVRLFTTHVRWRFLCAELYSVDFMCFCFSLRPLPSLSVRGRTQYLTFLSAVAGIGCVFRIFSHRDDGAVSQPTAFGRQGTLPSLSRFPPGLNRSFAAFSFKGLGLGVLCVDVPVCIPLGVSHWLGFLYGSSLSCILCHLASLSVSLCAVFSFDLFSSRI